MRTEMGAFAALAEQARQQSLFKEQQRRVAEIARQIDEVSGEMGSNAFVDAIRTHGYDVQADLGMLSRRGVDRFQH
ncbi:hypothetical protein [Tardiphaga sp.]|uniref:hypothetical protein n=1 Tax=Tardiphaga sp. TaxID=1926292 RepID=UPI0037D993B3